MLPSFSQKLPMVRLVISRFQRAPGIEQPLAFPDSAWNEIGQQFLPWLLNYG